MRLTSKLSWIVLALFGALFLGCSETSEQAAARPATAASAKARADYEVFRSLPSWQYGQYKNHQLLAQASPANTSVQISVKDQRGLLLVHGDVAMDFPVATGRSSHPTPMGQFTIKEKVSDYHSNIYGRTYDAYGNVVLPDADKRTDPIPEGGRFIEASMAYWMRLTDNGVGMHVGYVPGQPASHGCIRLKEDTAKQVFDLTRVGTPVLIADEAPALK